MRKIIFAALAAVSLAGCGADAQKFAAGVQTLSKVQAPSLDTVYALENAYDAAFATPVAAYRNLGICPLGTTFTLAKPCADRTIMVKLQGYNRQARAAFAKLEAFVQAHPGDLGASGLYDAAKGIVTTATDFLATVPGAGRA